MNKLLLIDLEDSLRNIRYKFLEASLNSVDRNISVARASLNGVTTKVVKGQTYFYRWDCGVWKYCGKENPKVEVSKKIKLLEEQKKKIRLDFEAKLKACNIKKFKKHHAVCNEKILMFKKALSERSLIKISELK
ncbi:MAG: hypothetical protein Q8N77_03740 [Nanoarchaeota archaeon]|nr:hypothetical protein [Nanoarchaeota archaeon]